MDEAQISVVVCGTHNQRWVAYGLVDADVKNIDFEKYGELFKDPISDMDASIPIWDAREYYLAVVQTNMNKALKEWQYLVRMVERWIETHVRSSSCSLPLSLCLIAAEKQART